MILTIRLGLGDVLRVSSTGASLAHVLRAAMNNPDFSASTSDEIHVTSVRLTHSDTAWFNSLTEISKKSGVPRDRLIRYAFHNYVQKQFRTASEVANAQ